MEYNAITLELREMFVEKMIVISIDHIRTVRNYGGMGQKGGLCIAVHQTEAGIEFKFSNGNIYSIVPKIITKTSVMGPSPFAKKLSRIVELA